MDEDTQPLLKEKGKIKMLPRVRMHFPPFQHPSRAPTPPNDLAMSSEGELASSRPVFHRDFASNDKAIPLVDLSRDLEGGSRSPDAHEIEDVEDKMHARDSVYGTPFSSGTTTPHEHVDGMPRRRWNQDVAAFPWDSMRQLLLPRKHNRGQSKTNMGDPALRQNFCMKLCRALMRYGAPTHRLEQCMKTTARHLQLEGQFLYLPGCMICSFDDRDLRTTEVKLVREKEGIDLDKLGDVINIYRDTVHDRLDVDESIQKLEAIMDRPERRGPWVKVFIHGLAAASVGPFAFGARPADLGPIFVLGCGVGFLQNKAAARSEGYASIFEVSTALLTAFASRGLGSIHYPNSKTPIFCFSAMAQSAIALILPGYIILCASLELQNRNIVAGSVRMVYAIIYALMLGFGTLIGAVLYGLMDKNATSDVSCAPARGMEWWDHYPEFSKFPFVPIFSLCLTTINQAKWRLEMFVMVVIACIGYLVNFYSSKSLGDNVQVANALGAIVIGFCGNIYSRYFGGIAAVILMPAIFVQVPSGIAASGSLVSGLTSADQITGNSSAPSVITNGTAGFQEAQNMTSSPRNPAYGGTVFNLGYGMVQVALAISVGLLFSSFASFPFGKRRSGVFSF